MDIILKPISQNKPDKITILLIPGFSLLPFTSLIEPLRMANRISDKQLYEYQLVSTDGLPVACSAEITINVDTSLEEIEKIDNLFVCSGIGAHLFNNKTVTRFLQRVSRDDTYIGAVCTATHILANAGILNGYRCTIHWENLDSLKETFPNLEVSTSLFEQDRNRISCCGSTAAFEMMIAIIKKKHNEALSHTICEQFIYEKIRAPEENDILPLRVRLQVKHPKLVKAITIMEENSEKIISREDISSQIGISCRQLERLFYQHIGISPRRYYLKLRLAKAYRLLEQTNLSIAEIAFASGFNTASHFSRCFRTFYGFTPRTNRNNKKANQGQ